MADNSLLSSLSLAAMLRSSHWVSGLGETELARVEAGVFERQVGAGQSACRKGESCDHWFGVIEGLLKMCSDRVTGKTATLAGISRQRVNRSLKLLEDAGFLTVEYGGVTILDLE